MGGVIALGLLAGGCYAHKPSGEHSVSGTIETDEVRVAPRYGGRVEKILVAEGDALKGGQVIAELDAAELRARRDQAAAQLAELEAGPRKEEIEAAKHDWEALAAELDQAQADAKRAEELFSQKTISQTEREQAVTRSRALQKMRPPPGAATTSSWPARAPNASPRPARSLPKLTPNCAR